MEQRTESPLKVLPSDLERYLDRAARKVVTLGLEAPVRFFLEAHLPFTTIFHTLGLACTPIATPLFGTERIGMLNSFLSERRNVEALMQRIELYSSKEEGELVQH